jgi:cysteine desulfuration protein SufE
MNEIELAQRELVDEFSVFDNWMDRYQYIIDLGRRLPEFPAADKTEENRIRGCQSQVWFVAEQAGEHLRFRATSDAAIVSGLIALLLRIYSGRRPADIVGTPAEFVTALQLEQHLSPTRSNGLAAMMSAIRNFAAAAQDNA